MSNGEPRSIQRARGLFDSMGLAKGTYPVVVAPYISGRGRELCRDLGLGYVDHAGNAHLKLPGLLVERWGKGNPEREARRLENLFSQKATWVMRAMFEHSGRDWTMEALAAEAHVSLGHVKKTVDRLDEEGYVRKERGAIGLSDAGGLLDAWREVRTLDGSRMEGYHTGARTQTKVLEALASVNTGEWALTLGAGASMVAPMVRTVDTHIYALEGSASFVEALDLTPVEFGGTVHLITPRDEAVLRYRRTIGGVQVVSDLQLYLDLYNWPTRGREQAEHLRRTVMGV